MDTLHMAMQSTAKQTPEFLNLPFHGGIRWYFAVMEEVENWKLEEFAWGACGREVIDDLRRKSSKVGWKTIKPQVLQRLEKQTFKVKEHPRGSFNFLFGISHLLATPSIELGHMSIWQTVYTSWLNISTKHSLQCFQALEVALRY